MISHVTLLFQNKELWQLSSAHYMTVLLHLLSVYLESQSMSVGELPQCLCKALRKILAL